MNKNKSIFELAIKYGDQYRLANRKIAYFFKISGPTSSEKLHYQFLVPDFGIVKYDKDGNLLYPHEIDDPSYSNGRLSIIEKI